MSTSVQGLTNPEHLHMIDSALEELLSALIGTYIVPVCIHILSYDNNISNDFSIVFFFLNFFLYSTNHYYNSVHAVFKT